MVTLKGKELEKFVLAVDGKYAHPHKAILGVYVGEEQEPLDAVDTLMFVEENILMLIPMCAEVHEQWLMFNLDEMPVGTVH
jgi:hypothetical protein